MCRKSKNSLCDNRLCVSLAARKKLQVAVTPAGRGIKPEVNTPVKSTGWREEKAGGGRAFSRRSTRHSQSRATHGLSYFPEVSQVSHI